MTKQFLILCLGLVVALASVHRASADIVDLIWTGVTLAGNDQLGLFGQPGPIAENTPYTATYRFDTDVSFMENTTNGSQEVSGGSFFNPFRPSPLISSSIEINGFTVDFNGLYNSSYFRSTGQGSSQVSTLSQREVVNPQPYGGELFQRVFRFGNFYDTRDLTVPGEFDFDANDNPGGNFNYFTVDGGGNITGSSAFGIIPSHLSIRVLVPEPATLASAAIAVLVLVRRRRNA